ncbi:MAG: zinc-ribbon domain-containing protein [Bacteroidota bacterium]
MIFIFGFDHERIYPQGPIEKKLCPQCKEEDFWFLEKKSIWFSLFFIPIFPYRYLYYKYCTRCGFTEGLHKEEFQSDQAKANLNQLAANGEISKEEYELKKNDL